MTDKPQSRNVGRIVIIALTLITLTLGSLWAGSRDFDKAAQPISAPTPMPVAEQKAAGEYSAASLTAGTDGTFLNRSGGATTVQAAYGEAQADSGAPAQNDGRKIVRTASLTLNTTVYDEDLTALRALLEGAGGYLSDFYEYGDASSGETRYATLYMRVPSSGLNAFIAGVEGIGRVVSRSESATDMTVQYTDNDARLQTLKTKRERLDELLKKAETTSDIIEIEGAMSDAQYEIDRYETWQRTIDRDVDMSAVDVTLREETPAESAAATDKSLGARLTAALRASFIGIGDFLRDMLVFAVMALPVIIPLALVVLVIALCRHRAKARSTKPDGAADKPGADADS